MKKLLILLPFIFFATFIMAQQGDGSVIEPRIDAQTLNGFDESYFLDTTDFAVTKVWYVDVNYSGDQLSNGTLFAPFTAIQQAFDSCSVGDIVLVYPGTYPAEHLHPIIDSIKLLSLSGPSQTFVALTASGGTGFDVDNEGMTIEGITFTGDAGFLIQLEGGEDAFTLRYCELDTEGTPSIGLNIGASGCSNMIVENNKFISETGDGAIWMEKNVTNPLIRNNWFVGSDSTSSYAIQTTGSTGGRYINNLIEGYASGIFLHTVTAGSGGTANEEITGNIIRNCSKAIRLGHTSQTVDMDSIFIFQNLCYHNSFGIEIANDGDVLSGTFLEIGNIYTDNTVNRRNAGTEPAYLNNHINGGTTMNGELDATTITVNSDYTFPAADGNANFIMETDGAGTLSFIANAGFAGVLGFDFSNPSMVRVFRVGDTLIYSTGHGHNELRLQTDRDFVGDVDITGDLVVSGDITHNHSSGLMFISTPGTFAITTGGTFEKLIGGAIDYSSDHLEDFNETTNGRLTYTGTLTKHFTVAVYSSIESGENTQEIEIRIAEGGSPIFGSEQEQTYSVINNHNTIPTGYIVELATNEYIEVFITSDTNGDNVIAHSCVVVITEY